MQFLEKTEASRNIKCIYCNQVGQFPHHSSFDYIGREFALFRCPTCESLMYDPQELWYTIPKPYTAEYKEATRIGCKYYLEGGYSADFVVHCALAALGGVSASTHKDHLFVDVGAGMGLASYFVKTTCNIEVVVIEPSYSGEIGKEMLGIEIHNAYFEDLPAPVIKKLKRKPTLLHLNSVVEHLRDPAAVIRELMERTQIDAIASVVPDGDKIDPKMPFSALLPYLAPGDHLHLPTVEGMRRFYAQLGFEHCEVRDMGGLLVAVGSRFPIELPTEEVILATRDVFLRKLMKHPNAYAAYGAAGRLLPNSIFGKDPALLNELRSYFQKAIDPQKYLDLLKGSTATWDDIPFNLASISFWMGVDCFARGLNAEAYVWMDLVDAVADRIVKDLPHFAMESLDYKWEARLHRSHHVVAQAKQELAKAQQCLDSVVAAAADTVNGPRPDKIQRAKDALLQLKV